MHFMLPSDNEQLEIAVKKDWRWLRKKLEVLYPRVKGGPRTHNKMDQAYRYLQRYAPSPAEITEETIFEALDEIDDGIRTPASVNTILRSMQSICSKLIKQKVLTINPFHSRNWYLDEDDMHERDQAHLTVAECQLMLNQADLEWEQAKGTFERFKTCRLRALAWLVLHCGPRAKEALYLQIGDYNGQTIKIHRLNHPGKRLKNKKSKREVFVPRAAAERLDEWILLFIREHHHKWLFPCIRKDNAWFSGDSNSRATSQMIELSKRAGTKTPATLQILRRTLNTHMTTRWGFTQAEAMRIVGHQSVETQEYYTLKDLDNMRERSKCIDFFEGKGPSAPLAASRASGQCGINVA